MNMNCNAMNAQPVSTVSTNAPKGGAELEYGDCSKIGAAYNEEQLPLIKVQVDSWREHCEEADTTDTENGFDEDSCGEQPPSGFVPVTGTAKPLPSSACPEPARLETESSAEVEAPRPFTCEETLLIFDWDDTILPSAWVQQQGLRLDDESHVSDFQREQLSQLANLAIETLRAAKQCGTVVMVTNAERGWIELSCQKFMPTLSPMLENIKLLSARTTYETRDMPSPLDWKVCAFQSEIWRLFGDEVVTSPAMRKNVLSLGDSMHEREALLRTTASLPNCRSKSLKFVERPDIGQICKQHSLITDCFDRIVHHDGNLDLCLRCA